MTPARLLDVRTGRVAPANGQLTAYGKESRAGPVAAHALGLEGDEVANSRVHGGPEKAVYAYASAAYARWRASHPQHRARLVPGAFGENLLFEGLDEESVCVGDRWRVGSALLEPCQPRQPCATLARWFGDPGMVKAMVGNGLSGWYCRVVEPGVLEAGVEARLEHRPEGAWTIARVLEASYRAAGSEELLALSRAPGLASGWAAWAARAARAPSPKPL